MITEADLQRHRQMTIEKAIAEDRRDRGYNEIHLGRPVLYCAPSGRVWLTDTQGEAFKTDELPNGWVIHSWRVTTCNIAPSVLA